MSVFLQISTTGSSTIHLRVNGVNVTNTVTITAGFVGVIEDTTHTDTIADGDKLVYRVVIGAGGSLTIALISIIFDATTDCISKQVSHSYAPNESSLSRYVNISGRYSGVTNLESNVDARVKKAGIAKNAFLFVSSNPRTTPTTFTLRKNGIDTAIVLTAAPGVTNTIYEDTSNSVSYAVDDTISWEVTTGTGTETLQTWTLSIDYISTVGHGFINGTSGCPSGATADLTLDPSVTEYYVVGGAMIEGVITEADAAIKARDSFTLFNLTVKAKANTLTAPSTLTLMKNGSPTAMSVTIGSGAAGFFSDTTNFVSYAAGDTMSYKMVTGSTGTMLTVGQIAVWTDILPHPARDLSENTIVDESKIRNKAAWRLQP